MKTLNQYSHNLTGVELICDNGNWTRHGKWNRKVYRVNADDTVQHVRTEHFWNNVSGESEEVSGEPFVPSCDGEAVFIAGTRCKMPLGARLELHPEHTCQEPKFHTYSYKWNGERHEESYNFCNIAEAKRKWDEFVDTYSDQNITLLKVDHTHV